MVNFGQHADEIYDHNNINCFLQNNQDIFVDVSFKTVYHAKLARLSAKTDLRGSPRPNMQTNL
jgi:hypothetical protein